ncbi:hypothetical protein FE634_15470 [Nocardioides dongxiaopingii]|uniref:hypothetical protein n=1 Tax=Nocardioides sp. S-1144 TaxID=2582905 RepID=UPI00110DAEA6|nr:hypothetical protein [Nocardioides sp. S-1144]QCW51458.1 hypothetical protein FE634_15470 [Nocardioides sp. S-1144]
MSKTPIPSDEQVRDREARWGHHLPVYPSRQSRVPAVLASEPTFRDLAAERDAVRAAETRLHREHEELTARNEVAKAKHSAAQREAMLTGTPPPAPLSFEPWPYPQHSRQTFDRLHGAIEAAELGLLEDDADRWRQVLESKADPLRRKVERARAALAEAEANLTPYVAGISALPAALAAVDGRRSWPRRDPEAADPAQVLEDFEALGRPTSNRLSRR